MWGNSHVSFLRYIKGEGIMEEFSYTIIDGVDKVFEEKGNQFGAVRKIQWGDKGPYLEVRKWRNTPDGGEQATKGYTFMTDEGPGELAKTLIDMGYGETKDVLDILKERYDFRKSLNSVLGKDDELFDEEAGTLEDDYFDPKEFLK